MGSFGKMSDLQVLFLGLGGRITYRRLIRLCWRSLTYKADCTAMSSATIWDRTGGTAPHGTDLWSIHPRRSFLLSSSHTRSRWWAAYAPCVRPAAAWCCRTGPVAESADSEAFSALEGR